MFVIVYFIHVCMDKHMQATEKIQAHVLEYMFVVYVPMVTFWFLYYFQMYMPVYITNTHANTVMGLFYVDRNELRSKGGLPSN